MLFALVLLGLRSRRRHRAAAIPALRKLGMLNTYFSMMLPFFLSVFAIFLFRQFFKSLPDEIIQAARLDGICEFDIVWRMLPSARPAITAFAVFSIVAHWNDYFWPLIVISTASSAPPPLGMIVLRRRGRLQLRRAVAAATIITAPLVIAFLIARRRFIAGITMTGIK